jgi:hypothetical protein
MPKGDNNYNSQKTTCLNGHTFDRTVVNNGKKRRICYTCNRARRNKYHKDGRYDIRDRDGAYRRRYGIGIEEYQTMFSAQKGMCAICGEGSRWRLSVDHDHETGAVRALLCQHCNIGIGNFFDDPNRLQAAAQYIERCRN